MLWSHEMDGGSWHGCPLVRPTCYRMVVLTSSDRSTTVGVDTEPTRVVTSWASSYRTSAGQTALALALLINLSGFANRQTGKSVLLLVVARGGNVIHNL